MNIWQTINTTLFHINRKKDLTPWEHPYSDVLPIYGVYHVFCAEGWEQLVPFQLERLRKSGLANQTKTLFISCIYRQETDLTKLHTMLTGIHYEIAASTSDANQYEYPALDLVYKKAKNSKCYIAHIQAFVAAFLILRKAVVAQDEEWIILLQIKHSLRVVIYYFIDQNVLLRHLRFVPLSSGYIFMCATI